MITSAAKKMDEERRVSCPPTIYHAAKKVVINHHFVIMVTEQKIGHGNEIDVGWIRVLGQGWGKRHSSLPA